MIYLYTTETQETLSEKNILFDQIGVQCGKCVTYKPRQGIIKINYPGVYRIIFNTSAAKANQSSGETAFQMFVNNEPYNGAVTSTTNSDGDMQNLSFATVLAVKPRCGWCIGRPLVILTFKNIGLNAKVQLANVVIERIGGE